MNTVKKGNKFEDLCFKLISSAIINKDLGVLPEYCKIFQKKGYWSNDRQDNIIFDISIEVWLPNSENFSLLYIIECKDYSVKPVPVDDIEEFCQKVTQVSGLNVKGIFITSNTYQSGAYTFARSKGIMLIEVNENITYNIVLHKVDRYSQVKNESNIKNKLSTKLYNDNSTKILQRKIDKEILSIFINYVRSNFPEIQKRVKSYLSAEEVEEIAVQLIGSFDRNIIQHPQKFPMDRFKRYLNEIFKLTFIDNKILGTDTQGRNIKSSCSFTERCIQIDRVFRNKLNYNFILAHEIGHFFLHNKLQIDQKSYEQFSDSKYSFMLGRYLLQNDRNWIEWQANQFAAALILPKKPLLFSFYKAQDKLGLKPGRPLYVDDQRCNQETFHKVIGELSYIFQATKSSVIYRLNRFDLINENYNVSSIGQILLNILNIDPEK